ncbi:MAG: capsule assembly Wzi family protein [bacterium]
MRALSPREALLRVAAICAAFFACDAPARAGITVRADSAEAAIHASDIEGGRSALWRNHDGDPARQGLAATIEAGAAARAGSHAGFALRPRLSLAGGDARATWLEALLTLQAGGAHLDLGRTRLWLGPARYGSLLLSNNAHPLDLVHAHGGGSTANTLPLLRALRGVRGGAAVAWLRERDRDYPNPNLGVLYVVSEWSDWLQIDLHRTMMFGGEGRGFRVSWESLADLLFARGSENSTDPDENLSDQLAAIAFVVRPDLFLARWIDGARIDDGGVRAFYEYAGDDNLDDWIPQNPGIATGLTVWRGEWEVHAELAVNRKDTAPWYEHSIYRTGYRYRGVILGHHMGSDANDATLALAAPLPRGRRLRALADRRGALFTEREQPATEWSVAASAENLWTRGRAALAADILLRWGNDWPTARLGAIERRRVSLRWTWTP